MAAASLHVHVCCLWSVRLLFLLELAPLSCAVFTMLISVLPHGSILQAPPSNWSETVMVPAVPGCRHRKCLQPLHPGCYRPCVKQPCVGFTLLGLSPTVVFVLGAMISFHCQLALATLLCTAVSSSDTHCAPQARCAGSSVTLLCAQPLWGLMFLWLCGTLPCHVHVTCVMCM